mgnify:CR=1 FL=1
MGALPHRGACAPALASKAHSSEPTPVPPEIGRFPSAPIPAPAPTAPTAVPSPPIAKARARAPGAHVRRPGPCATQPCRWTNPTLGEIAHEHHRLSLRARLAERGNPTGLVDCRSRLGSFAMTNCRCSLAQRRSNPSSWIAAPSFLGVAMTNDRREIFGLRFAPCPILDRTPGLKPTGLRV